MQSTTRVGLWTCALIAMAMSACAGPASLDEAIGPKPSVDDDHSLPSSSTQSGAPESSDPRAHRVSEQPVSVEWIDDVDRTLLMTEQSLRALVTNHTEDTLRVDLAAIGEDTSKAHAAYVAQFALAAGEARELEVSLDRVPVQTTSAASPLRLMAVLPDLNRQIPSLDLSIAFNESFDVAFVSARNALGPTLAAKLHGDVTHRRIVELAKEVDARVLPDELELGVNDEAPSVTGRVLTGNSFAPLLATNPSSPLVTMGAPLSITRAGVANPAIRDLNPNTNDIIYVPFPINISVRLCARWTATFSDSAIWGEDELNEGRFQSVGTGDSTFFMFLYDPVPARFARAWVRNITSGAYVYTGPLDQEGCVDLWIPGGRYSLSVSSLLRKGDTTYDIRELYPKGIDYTCPYTTMRDPRGLRAECETNGSFSREFSVSRPLNRWETVRATLDSGYATHFGRVAAVAGLMLAKDNGGMVAGKEYIVYSNSGCEQFGWMEACADSKAYFGISIGASATDTTLEKFAVAHELGHQLEFQRSANKRSHYPLPAGFPGLCSCEHVTHGNNWHCLQSRHDYSTAHTEGFAQFVAARTMNDNAEPDCTFTYYKDVKFADGTLKAPPVRTDCATPPRWVATHCPASNTTSEWDIMAYYRALTTGTDALTMDELLRTLAGASYDLTWTSFRDSAASVLGTASPKLARLVALATAYGVNL